MDPGLSPEEPHKGDEKHLKDYHLFFILCFLELRYE